MGGICLEVISLGDYVHGILAWAGFFVVGGIGGGILVEDIGGGIIVGG